MRGAAGAAPRAAPDAGGAPAPDLIARLSAAAERLAAMARAAPGARALPTPDWLARAEAAGTLRRPVAWRNTVVRTPALRRLHVEFFALPGEIGVLHLCAFPRLDRALPILGFDVIAGREKATGCFLDLSPTVPAAEPAIEAWAAGLDGRPAATGEPRELPEWGTIFSPRVVAVRPRGAAEVEAGLDLGEATLAALLSADPAAADPQPMWAAQARYVAGQRRNDRTRRMLAGCIGAEMAEAFIAACLFPMPGRPPGMGRHGTGGIRPRGAKRTASPARAVGLGGGAAVSAAASR